MRPLRISSLHTAQGINRVMFYFLFISLPLHFGFKLKSRFLLYQYSRPGPEGGLGWQRHCRFLCMEELIHTAVHPHCKYMYLKKQYQVKFSSGLSRRTIFAPKGKSSLSLQEPWQALCSTAEHYAGSHASMSSKALGVKTCRSLDPLSSAAKRNP